MRDGNGFAQCPHKVGSFETRRRCGQHFYWLCSDRLCTVIALSADERHRFDDGHYTSGEILRALGVGAAA
ncbi:MAG TPA: hypothetical protein VFI96_01725 [Longimicrobiaceae bacterium]|nr:hypothetical protein [Longimicrobiaceae bacterium]